MIADPRDPDVTQADYDEQFRVTMAVADTLQHVRTAIDRLEELSARTDSAVAWSASAGSSADAVAERLDSFAATMEGLERRLAGYQTDEGPAGLRSVSGLDRQYGTLLSNLNGGGGYGGGSTEGPPTEGALQRMRDLDAEWGVIFRAVADLLDNQLPDLDTEIERLGGPRIGAR